MSVIRVGSSSKYADGWEQIFGGAGGRGRKPAAAKKAAAKRAVKKAGRKQPAAKKKSKSRR